VELAGAFLLLADHRLWSAAPVILRSMLESFADLRGLLADPGYAKRMLATVIRDWIRLLEKARKDPDGGFLADLRDLDARAGLMEDLRRALKELGAAPPLQVRERFEIAGMVPEYRSVYARLSAQAHGDLGVVLDRRGTEKGEIDLCKEPPDEDVMPWCDKAANILLLSGEASHGPERLEPLRAEFERIRGSYHA
jgi:hypothetical protein